ncbi:MAG: PIG-L family deacetylase [Alphaproteobacteria bacterium]|nr:PIG-L family deacetylase [Alphaproteobacteria bacterium]
MGAEQQKFVGTFSGLLRESLPPPSAPQNPPEISLEHPSILLFSPHPDDESINGGLALRLKRETGWQVINIAVTLGSDIKRHETRRRELEAACGVLQFGLREPVPGGFANIKISERTANPESWLAMTKTVRTLLAAYTPRVVIFPHADDLHPAHTGTHFLVMDALAAMPGDFDAHLALTEFWYPQAAPTLLSEISEDDAAQLLTALSCHAGEISRNPYHLRLLPWFADNVRRGAETVGGYGDTAPDFAFGMLHTIARWQHGRLSTGMQQRVITAGEKISELFAD